MSNSIEFEPFGEFIVDYAGLAQLPRLGWIGKERDAETDFGNFGVRNYEFGTGRFLSGDALWEEYRGLSVFHYTANSPLIGKDPSGLDVIALFVPYDAEGNGHVAVLVGNDSDGWLYVDAYGELFPLGLGGPDDDRTRKFAKLSEFMDSPIYYSHYQYGYAIVTNRAQDFAAKLVAARELDKDYNAKDCNCGDLLNEVLNAVGVTLEDSKGTAKVFGFEFEDVTIPNKQMAELDKRAKQEVSIVDFFQINKNFKREHRKWYVDFVKSRDLSTHPLQHRVRDLPDN